MIDSITKYVNLNEVHHLKKLQNEPLPILNRVITPISMVITPVTHLFAAIYRGPVITDHELTIASHELKAPSSREGSLMVIMKCSSSYNRIFQALFIIVNNDFILESATRIQTTHQKKTKKLTKREKNTGFSVCQLTSCSAVGSSRDSKNHHLARSCSLARLHLDLHPQ